ncbi:uncharacterized protein LOC118562569 [Fundulus heteroclitus]|uniref:uncharacterized protein LOC118562569 n=1 Tax=Fundulus heteroclitus TaxID=8078 RepID=UPI00165AD4F0|nr:uncharacterized protein LOC118562569 [Fundulus heteroclitus]
MDSTKKVTKKLAGAAANTAGWCTNVGNEHGQVLVSVLTAAEGHGLWPMAAGLMRRYREAGVAPPAIMYVDRDCCSPHGQSQVRAMFAEWRELQVRLDIWHFMRRFAAGVTTEAHQLYGVFMARLSRCIFQLMLLLLGWPSRGSFWPRELVQSLRRPWSMRWTVRRGGTLWECPWWTTSAFSRSGRTSRETSPVFRTQRASLCT